MRKSGEGTVEKGRGSQAEGTALGQGPEASSSAVSQAGRRGKA